MAILIPSEHIYEIENPKILDNVIKNISFNKNTYVVSKLNLYNETDFSGETKNILYFVGEWGIGAGIERERYKLACEYKTYRFFVSTQNSLLYDSLQVIVTLSTDGNLDNAGNLIYEKLEIQRGTLDYEVDKSRIPSFVDAYGSIELQKYCNDLFREKIRYELEPIDLHSFYITINYLNKIQISYETQTFDGISWSESKITALYEPYILNNLLEVSSNYNTISSQVSTIGEIGNSFSLEDNELLQVDTTINSQKISHYLCNKILQSYSKGKEVATLLCDIGEYFNDDETIAKSTQNILDGFSYEFIEFHGIYVKFTYKPRSFDYKIIFDYSLNGEAKTISVIAPKGTTTTSTLLAQEGETYTLPTNFETNISMKFEIGDEVIPMVFGADGKDRPMSRKADGSAKVFRVLGNRIFYDGAVWQQISLQEI